MDCTLYDINYVISSSEQKAVSQGTSMKNFSISDQCLPFFIASSVLILLDFRMT